MGGTGGLAGVVKQDDGGQRGHGCGDGGQECDVMITHRQMVSSHADTLGAHRDPATQPGRLNSCGNSAADHLDAS